MHQVPPDCALDDSPGPPPPEPAPCVCVQELVEIVGRSAGVVIMAPPDDAPEAQAALATLLSSLKPKQKARAAARPARGREGQRAPARQTRLLPPALPAPGTAAWSRAAGRTPATRLSRPTAASRGCTQAVLQPVVGMAWGTGPLMRGRASCIQVCSGGSAAGHPGARAGARCWWRSRTAGAMSPWTRW